MRAYQDLTEAVLDNDIPRTKRVLAREPLAHHHIITSGDWRDWSLLASVVWSKRREMLALFLKREVKANQHMPNGLWSGWSLLAYAVRQEWTVGAELLLEHGADPDQVMPDGIWVAWSLLSFAVYHNAVSLVSTLLEKTDVHGRSLAANSVILNGKFEGYSLIEFALLTGKWATAQALLKYGADPKQIIKHGDFKGRSLLAYAVFKEWPETARLIYEHGKNANDPITSAVQYCQQALDEAYTRAQKDLDFIFAHTEIISNEDLNAIGKMYYKAKGVKQDYSKAMLWFEKARERDLAAAYRNLGLFYEYPGRGVAQNFVTAAKYYQQALDRGWAHAQADLNRLFNMKEISGVNLNNIGVLYCSNDGVAQNLEKGKLWLEEACNRACAAAYRNLGVLYEYHGMTINPHAMTMNLVIAARHYQQALERAWVDAQADLDRLFDAMSATDLNNVGLMYSNAEGGIKRDYIQARRWHEKAIAKDGTCSGAYYNLGVLFENGQGMVRNRVTAAKYYQQALERALTDAQIDLDRLFVSDEVNGSDLNSIGMLYRYGDGIAVDYLKARLWFERSRVKGNADACRNLGMLYENGLGVVKDLVMAAQYYREALERGYDEGSLQGDYDRLVADPDVALLPAFLQKSLERKFELSLLRARVARPDYKHRRDIHREDIHGDTLLRRASMRRQLKNRARFFLVGGSEDDMRRLAPPLSELQNTKVIQLQDQLSELLSNLHGDSSVLENLASRIFVNGANITRQAILNSLRDMYAINEIGPLMDLAKFCALALHDLSKRRKFTDASYDSDDDDEELIGISQKLTIRIDARREAVERIFHYGVDGQGGRKALGVYAHGNAIYLGGARLTNELRGTLIHELTHFLTQEIFKNRCNPYLAGSDQEGVFEAIATELYGRRNRIDPVLANIFLPIENGGYLRDRWHAELIVRVPQMILQYKDEPENGLARLRRQAPALLAHYNDVFLVAVKAHAAKLEERALSGWPRALFEEAAALEGRGFSFERF